MQNELLLSPPHSGYKTTDVTEIRGTKFEDFCLKRKLLMSICEKRWEHPSPIQEAAIPIVLSGKNILARAKNGTGKTGAFCIPVLEQIEPSVESLQALIIVPTKEIALQIAEVCADLAKYLHIQIMPLIRSTCLKSGFPNYWEKKQLITGTAGRIYDILKRDIIDMSNFKILVLDDVDGVLSSDFRGGLDRIMGKMPKDIQILLLSAVLTSHVMSFQRRYLTEPYEIYQTEDLALKGVTQYYAFLHESQKVHCISRILSTFHIKQSLIFCNSALRAELLAKHITELGYGCYYVHGQMVKHCRNTALRDFRAGYCRNLTCTDLLAHGIDIPAVNIVINFDFPPTAETYLHRIGRCGRYGTLGIAISLVTEGNKRGMFKVERKFGVEMQPLRTKDEPIMNTPNTVGACPQITTESNILANDQVKTMAVTLIEQIIEFDKNK